MELLPVILADLDRRTWWSDNEEWMAEYAAHDRERKALLRAIAADLGVEIPQPVA